MRRIRVTNERKEVGCLEIHLIMCIEIIYIKGGISNKWRKAEFVQYCQMNGELPFEGGGHCAKYFPNRL